MIEGIASSMEDCEGVRFFAQDSADTRLLDVPPGSFGRATEGDSGVRCISKGRKRVSKGKRTDEETRCRRREKDGRGCWENERE